MQHRFGRKAPTGRHLISLSSAASAGVINELIIAHNITPYSPLRLFYRTSLPTLIGEEPKIQ